MYLRSFTNTVRYNARLALNFRLDLRVCKTLARNVGELCSNLHSSKLVVDVEGKIYPGCINELFLIMRKNWTARLSWVAVGSSLRSSVYTCVGAEEDLHGETN